MSHRFFLDAEIHDRKTTLEGDQAHHAIHVMRSKVGDKISLFDGKGTEHIAVIVEVGKKQLQLVVQQSAATVHQSQREFTIAVALPKGDRQKFLVEKLVELGAHRLIPLNTSRSVAVANEKVIERMNRHVIEASKQCGRNFLMTVEPESSILQLVATVSNADIRLVAEPYAQSNLIDSVSTKSQPAIIAIGPEGGFADEEHEMFQAAGWKNVCLSPMILRIETAALAAAVLLANVKSTT